MKPDADFAGQRVAAFESRLAGSMADLITKYGGVPVVAPSLREVPLGDNPAALRFARGLIAGEFDIVIFLTGVGARYLAAEVETQIPREDWISALGRTRVVVRGPKPLAALRELQARVDLQVPEPNTWHEVLATLDAAWNVAQLRIAVQEYGQPNPELIAGLEARGASVTSVPVYRWELPEDVTPLRETVAEINSGQIGVALFTAAQQVANLFRVAAADGREEALRSALQRSVVVASIGPTTSESLRSQGLAADIEPEHSKMGHLVVAAARGWRQVAKPAAAHPLPSAGEGRRDSGRVRGGAPAGAAAEEARPLTRAASRRPSPARGEDAEGRGDRLNESPFLKACRSESTGVTPIWLMRQAGRYMAEYRAMRSKVSFLELCKRPDLAAEVTVTAALRLGVDAAILFADILLILEPMGLELEFSKGEGPVIHNPVRTASDVDRVRPLTDLEELDFVFNAVRAVRSSLPADMPLIGFAGAPFTVACYAIEGGSSRHYDRAKAFMYRDPAAWDVIMAKLVEATSAYLNAQVAAGTQAVQLFDSWVGTLSPADYERFVQPHMKRLFAALPPDVPTIHFGTGTGALLELQRDAGGTVIGLDWRVELDRARERLGWSVAVQGNLDPAVLLAPIPEIERQARAILAQSAGRPGHVFNLGHSILPNTPVDHVKSLVDFVHANSLRKG
jgi:uroporphyrinogen decarboxylase